MKNSELIERQKWPLDKKIEYSLEKIWEFYHYHNGNVAVSFSGGKDSSLLLWLCRMEFPNMPAVFANTRSEYPEILKFVRQTPNVKTVFGKYRFREIVENYGWPMVSKKVSRFVHDLQNPTKNNERTRILRETGITKDGREIKRYKIPEKWRFMVNSPFKFSDRCCVFMKEFPMDLVKNAAFVGTLAEDSQRRTMGYLQHGCNYFGKTSRSMPLGFWTKTDVLECIYKYKIPFSTIYGKLKRNNDGELKFTKMQSTGCVFCGFGVQFEQRPNRFEKLRESHPRLWHYAINRLGLGPVLDFMRENCGNPDLFNY